MLTDKLTINWGAGDQPLLNNCEEIYIATALITNWSLDFVIKRIPEKAKLKLIVGIHLPSSIEALEKIIELQKEGRVECKLYIANFFHPKLYLIKTSTSQHAFIGSGNFTKGGLYKNVEIFHEETDSVEFNKYKLWFDARFQEAIPFNESELDLIKPFFDRKRAITHQDEEETKTLIAELAGEINLDQIDFRNQFFKKEHYETMNVDYQPRMDNEVLQMRKKVRLKLFELHDLIYPKFPKHWNLHSHYQTDHIVSSIDTQWHNEDKVSGMWIHYGRGQREIKKYGDDKSPVQFMRLQVLIRNSHLAVWLCVGKDHGSAEDREYIAKNLENNNYLEKLWKSISQIKDYILVIGDEEKNIGEFKSSQELKDFLLNDDWKKYYFVLKKKFNPDESSISTKNICDTIINEFQKLHPIYVHFKDKTFE